MTNKYLFMAFDNFMEFTEFARLQKSILRTKGTVYKNKTNTLLKITIIMT